jgi:8-oxo-dGTP diphosphatase
MTEYSESFDYLLNDSRSEGIQRFVVGAVIKNNENHVLILKRASNDFMGGIDELPSGKVEANETLIQALQREIKEETNLDIETIVKYLGSFDYKSKSGNATRQFNFLIHARDVNQLKISDEHEKAQWVKPSAMEAYNITEPVKVIINKA